MQKQSHVAFPGNFVRGGSAGKQEEPSSARLKAAERAGDQRFYARGGCTLAAGVWMCRNRVYHYVLFLHVERSSGGPAARLEGSRVESCRLRALPSV